MMMMKMMKMKVTEANEIARWITRSNGEERQLSKKREDGR
jgi:hypothetical protein